MKNGILVLHKKASPVELFVSEVGKYLPLTIVNTAVEAFEYIENPSSLKNIKTIVIDVSVEFSVAIAFLRKLVTIKGIAEMPIAAISSTLDPSVQDQFILEGITEFIDINSSIKRAVLQINHILDFQKKSNVLEELALDELTGLYTRPAFLRKAHEFMDSNPDDDFIIFATDFENFKFTNSQYGEDKCDEFLKYIGDEFKRLVKFGFSGRWGGDQFITICKVIKNFNVNEMYSHVENGLLQAPIPHQKAKLGVYKNIDKSKSISHCCNTAFQIIRDIKGSYTQNIVFYEESNKTKFGVEQSIVKSMEQALLEKQFLVYYQPKHETVTGRIGGAEALIRWIHPEEGFMNPGQFIPLFEKNGFITKLDSYVIHQVCEDILRWKKEGIPVVPISINISRRDYLEKDWMKNQVEYIDSLGIDHKLIHFEVTESLYAEYMDLIIEQVRDVQQQNFEIEMDDFGSGYSTLGLLATFPLNIIKLDISFVRHIDINEIVIENIIKMSHRMGYKVVAEGIESREQFNTLKSLGCDLIQGYAFSKPISCKEWEEYVLKNGTTVIENPDSINQMASESGNEALNEKLLKAASDLGDSIPGGFFSYHSDSDQEIISFNRELLEIFDCDTGAEFRELVGNSFKNMMESSEEYERVTREIGSQIMVDNDICHVKYTVKTKNGTVRYLEHYGRQVTTNKYGKIFYVFLNDITTIHKQHELIRNRSEVIEGLSRSYVSIYLIEFETKRVIPYSISPYYKEAMMGMINDGLDWDEICVEFANRYVLESEREAAIKNSVIENIKKQFEKVDIFAFTMHMSIAGHDTLTEVTFRKLFDENKGNKAVITFRSVSESMIDSEMERNQVLLQQLQEHKVREISAALKLQQAYEAADMANKARALMMGKFADDVTNLLTKINKDSKDALQSNDIEKVKENVQKAAEFEEKVLRMVNNIKITAKIINGDGNIGEIHMDAIDCSSAAEMTLLNIKEYAEKNDIKIESFMNVENPYIYQDLEKTSQITLSILSNAMNYTLPGGKITFGLNQYPGNNPDECVIEFVCRDTGIGISEEFMPKLFEAFTREDNAINEKITGPGLGLYISKCLIDKLGGKISVFSKQGVGTEIKVIQKHKFADPSVAKKLF